MIGWTEYHMRLFADLVRADAEWRQLLRRNRRWGWHEISCQRQARRVYDAACVRLARADTFIARRAARLAGKHVVTLTPWHYDEKWRAIHNGEASQWPREREV